MEHYSPCFRYWLSATTLNAVDDFYDYANQDNFLTPPEGLNVLLHTFGKSTGQEGAPMFQQALNQSMLYDCMKKRTLFNFPWGTLSTALMEVLEQTAPDITYHYINTASDQVKETIYHELAHASHYRLVGNTYWNKLRWHVIANDGGYGDPTDPGPGSAFGRVAVSEAWGYHIGPTFADRQYGLNHSNTTLINPSIIEDRRHLNLLESRQWASGFIPRGLMLDLIDDNLNDYPSEDAYNNLEIIPLEGEVNLIQVGSVSYIEFNYDYKNQMYQAAFCFIPKKSGIFHFEVESRIVFYNLEYEIDLSLCGKEYWELIYKMNDSGDNNYEYIALTPDSLCSTTSKALFDQLAGYNFYVVE